MPRAKYPGQINAISESAMAGLSNLKDACGLSNAKEAVCPAFFVPLAGIRRYSSARMASSLELSRIGRRFFVIY